MDRNRRRRKRRPVVRHCVRTRARAHRAVEGAGRIRIRIAGRVIRAARISSGGGLSRGGRGRRYIRGARLI